MFVENLSYGIHGTIDKYRLMNDSKFVAVKTFYSDEGDIAPAALRELHILQVFRGCSNIVQLLNIEITMIDNITLKIIMPYHTSDLKVFIRTIPFNERVQYCQIIISQLLSALYQLYYRGIIHRDIKPENILIDYEFDKVNKKITSYPRAYLADFGLAIQLPCNTDYRDIELDVNVYMLLYRPPEVLLGRNYTDKADIWAVGVTILEYFIGEPFTENAALNNASVMQEILTYLQHPLATKLPIHDTIDLHKIFKSNLNSYQVNLIPENIVILLTSMLQIHPDDRAHITDLITNVEVCKIIDVSLLRGQLITETYYNTIKLMITMSKRLILTVRTCVAAIDLFDRYVTNYVTMDNILIAATCLYLTSKIIERFAPEPSDFLYIFDNKFTLHELREMEVHILQRMNYIIVSCDIDEIVHRVGEDYFNILIKGYQLMEENGVMNYAEILKYL